MNFKEISYTIILVIWSYDFPELQKEYFCPVSGFSTEKCPNHEFENL